ncbi:hypothetical protein [Alicyclobacillus sp. SO9]|uniref:hypothetical protein n=1 Tax=Alicyclobacillus sp. SO9 TaxID=2665646 RepID=UPI0018E6EC43|nr:hypothetical protein [Alicyclobacillus sp. SO9]QQE79529.1 hypothetical protein GI364_03270 [Alicyclobacillus sp. SO9]
MENNTYFDRTAFQEFCKRYRAQDPTIWQPDNKVLTAGAAPQQLHMTAKKHAVLVPETMLDVEWAHVIAPKARLVIVGTYGLSKSRLNKILTTYHVSVVSDSHTGIYLGTRSLGNPKPLQYVSWAAKHHAVFTASGDGGSLLEKEANIPQVVFVGGTQLNPFDKTFNMRSFPTWPAEGYGHAVFQIPALPYQRSIAGYWRRTPDVVWQAGYPGVVLEVQNGKWIHAEGTSLSTPLWAAMWALGDKVHEMKTGEALSPNANEVLYRLHTQNPSAFLKMSGQRHQGLGMPSPSFVKDIGSFKNNVIKSYSDGYPTWLLDTLRGILLALLCTSGALFWRAIKHKRYKGLSWVLAYLTVALVIGLYDASFDPEWFYVPIKAGNLPLRLLSLFELLFAAFGFLLLMRTYMIRTSHQLTRKLRKRVRNRRSQKERHTPINKSGSS